MATITYEQLPGPKTESSERWVRVKLNDKTIADSKQPTLLLQYGPGMLPTYFFKENQVRMDLLEDAGQVDGKQFWHVKSGQIIAEQAAWRYIAVPGQLPGLHGLITFVWNRELSWFEEEEEVFVHARDPYKRVDVLPSSRHIQIKVNSQILADSKRPHLLFETHLPTRFYIPREDVNTDFLEPTEAHSRCPYKGLADYWSIKVGETVLENVVWSYPDPIPECPKIRDLMCFYNEKVDIYLDGELQPRPNTPWS